MPGARPFSPTLGGIRTLVRSFAEFTLSEVEGLRVTAYDTSMRRDYPNPYPKAEPGFPNPGATANVWGFGDPVQI